MKKLLFLILFTFFGQFCFSQIPNAGFESWTNVDTYDNPDSWGTMNNTTAPFAIFTANKATPGNPGSYYLKLTSRTVNSAVVNGIAVSGVIDTITLQPKSGFPFTQRPQSLTGNWQHMIYGTSHGSIAVYLTKWNSGSRDTVAKAILALSGMVMSWAAFTDNFTYQSGEYPDTCVIVLKASGATPANQDYLWVDNLAFSGSVAGINENLDQGLTLKSYPNPANNLIAFAYSKTFLPGDRMLVTDMLGNVILEKVIKENSFTINTSTFANGNYIYKLTNRFGVQYTDGRFTIQH